MRERRTRSSGARPERGAAVGVGDREALLAHEQLRRGDVDRAGGFSETTASKRPAARWQSESASEPMIRMR